MLAVELLEDQLMTTNNVEFKLIAFDGCFTDMFLIGEEQKIKSQIFCSKDEMEQWVSGEVDRYHRTQIFFLIFDKNIIDMKEHKYVIDANVDITENKYDRYQK